MPRLALLLALLLLPACKKPPKDAAADVSYTPPPKEDVREAPPPAVAAVIRNFERVRFDFDSARLDETSRAALAENAAILASIQDVRVEVQGHADERGTTDYNLSLGQKRAAAVRDYLLSQGVAPSRLTVISYGEERPLASGDGETAWAQNRRAEFRVTWGGDGVVEGTVR